MANAAVSPAREKGGAKNIVAWVLCILLACEFISVGVLKLIGASAEVQIFDQVGIGQWFRYFTGVIEVLFGLALLAPKRSRRAAAVLMLGMLGAITAHPTRLHSSPLVAIATLVLLVAAARLRRPAVR